MKIILAFFFLAPFLFSGCGSTSLSVKKGYDFRGIKQVAILSFSGSPPSAGILAAELFTEELITLSFPVLNQEEMKKIVDDLGLQGDQLRELDRIREAGRIADVDALVYGFIDVPPVRGRRRGRADKPGQKGPGLMSPSITLKVHMIEVETGNVLWVGQVNKKTDNPKKAIKWAIKKISKKLQDYFLENSTPPS